MAHSPHVGKSAQNVSTDVSPGADISFRFHLHVFVFFLSCWSVWVGEVMGWGFQPEKERLVCIQQGLLYDVDFFSKVSSFVQTFKK